MVEQYLDFAVYRAFRESLLVHAGRVPQIRYDPQPSRFGPLHFAAWTPPVDGPTVMDHSRQEFQVADDATLFTNDPGLKATLEVLNDRWPCTLSRRELVDAVRARLVGAGFQPSVDLAGHVDSLMGVPIVQGQVRYRLDPVLPQASSSASPRLDEPRRRMAKLTRSDPDASIFNLCHEPLLPSPVDRHLLPLLDRTRDRDALVEALVAIDEENPIGMDREALAECVDGLPERLTEMKLARVR